ncbi:MAG: PilX N-terminal domain-containing pilus assembly protein [Betaproteobacteria bacterium]|nr:PilX N-terminal domain-containing pilus assembly protein [Betaproteobacteria bacterium]
MTRPAAAPHILPVFRPQRGAALVIAMILLLIMSLLAAASLRETHMQERMSSNSHDRDLAFQSAEAGLKMGERQAENWVKSGAANADLASCQNPSLKGLYRNVDAQCPIPLWEGPAPGELGAFWHDASADPGGDGIRFTDKGLSLAPFYIVELISENAPCQINSPDLNTTCKRFRVTASSRSAEGRARVTLQSIYATE